MTRCVAIPLLAALVATGVACSNTGNADGRVVIAAAFYPIEEIVRNVGGDLVDVVTLVPPGQEAHEYDPTPKQVTRLEQADVAVFLGQGFQPNVEKAIASLPSRVQRVDLLDDLTLLPITSQLPGTDGAAPGEELNGHEDPHVWLDPVNMQRMTASVLTALQAADPTHSQTYAARAEEYTTTLRSLDTDLSAGLESCASDLLVTTHRAFGYLAAAYGLTQVAIAGISPAEEPSAKTLEAVAAFAKANHVTTIFFEENLPDDLAATVASEIGATTAVLDTLETLSSDQLRNGADYVSVMRENLTALQKGLGCS